MAEIVQAVESVCRRNLSGKLAVSEDSNAPADYFIGIFGNVCPIAEVRLVSILARCGAEVGDGVLDQLELGDSTDVGMLGSKAVSFVPSPASGIDEPDGEAVCGASGVGGEGIVGGGREQVGLDRWSCSSCGCWGCCVRILAGVMPKVTILLPFVTIVSA